MVIVMQEGATDAQIQHVIDRLVASGFNVHRSTGESHTVLGAVGVHRDFDHRDFELLEGVREVMRITQPFKLASREFKTEDTIVDLGRGVKIGGNEVVVAAGPCSVESRDQIQSIAESVAKAGAKILRAGAFKPRTSPYAFQGMGEKGLELMREAAAFPATKNPPLPPILADRSHGPGPRDKVPPMARAAIAAGADGLLIEVHNDPDHALSDGAQSLEPGQFNQLMSELRIIAPAIGRRLA